MDIKEALEYIHNVKWQKSKPGLSRTRELLGKLGNPERELKFIHVAGTNGKGSTCAMIASILMQAGYTTGLYTSPFIMSFNERIRVNGVPISDDDLAALTEEIKPYADIMEDAPTEFEVVTALAMKYFQQYGCDIVVLEVGMGGRLDSTNVIDTPELAVITAIGFDHTEYLGDTLGKIAGEKAGIIKPGGDVLIYGGEPEVEEVFREKAALCGAKLHKCIFERITKLNVSLAGTRLIIEPYEEIHLPLAGTYQAYNAAMAVTAAEILNEKNYRITTENIINGVREVSWPGRFEILGYNPVFILDGAHNPHGIKAAAESLKAYFGERKIIFIMGVLADKDIQAMISELIPLAQHVFTVAPNSPRTMDTAELADIFTQKGIPAASCKSVSEGVELALDMAEGGADAASASGHGSHGIICAIGSLYMSADIRRAYERLNP